MGIAYRCDTEIGCTFVVWEKDVTPEVWRAHRDELFGDAVFPSGPKMLVDLTKAAGAKHVPGEVIEEMATSWRNRELGVLRIAIVPDAAWSKARQFERDLAGSDLTVVVFNDFLTASTWPGVDTTHAQAVLNELHAGLTSSRRRSLCAVAGRTSVCGCVDRESQRQPLHFAANIHMATRDARARGDCVVDRATVTVDGWATRASERRRVPSWG